MPFDFSTATPVQEDTKAGFDFSTAKPVDQTKDEIGRAHV